MSGRASHPPHLAGCGPSRAAGHARTRARRDDLSGPPTVSRLGGGSQRAPGSTEHPAGGRRSCPGSLPSWRRAVKRQRRSD
eukprot:5057893-Prymnesium_polylepis.1